jgi:Uma2 family endonuclease
MALPEYPVMSVEDYLTLDRNSKDARYEYLEGELRMLAGGSVYHSLIAANVTGILYGHLRGKPCRVYNSDIRLQLSQSRYVYPDVTVSCDQRDQEPGDTIRYPRVIIEVLSPSTEVTDRIKKFAYYRECPTVQEYVMIDSQKIGVEVYRREEEGWMLQTLRLKNVLLLKSLGIQISVEAIYEGVKLNDKL